MKPVSPDHCVFAVGDIHGEFGLLKNLLSKVVSAGLHENHNSNRLVFLGDFIDRGKHSDRVLATLFSASLDLPDRVICLLGNHEKMLLEFIDQPEAWGSIWLKSGGLQTLASYRIGNVNETSGREIFRRARDELVKRLPSGVENWLRSLPSYWESGNLALSHAGAAVDFPISMQTEDELIWGRSDFFRKTRSDGIWIAHSHAVVDEPKAEHGRISIDSGGCFTGKLGMAVIRENGEVRFIFG